MIPTIISTYYTFGLIMLVWYVAGYRWTMQGNQLGKWISETDATGQISNSFVLNWWFAPINMLTAFLSAYFVLRALFFTGMSFTQNMMYLAAFLFIRNGYYAVEDFIDYLNYPSRKQFNFIAIDLIMAIFVLLWVVRFHLKY